MSGGSGAGSEVISLAKGGGAMHGIGEKFSPDLHTGTGNFTVPITLPPGRNGFQPKIDLVYSTGQGNGPFGLGWVLNIPGISRKTSKGIPRYRDHSSELEHQDTFILSGAEDLVPISDTTQSPTFYRPRTEGLFAQIAHHWEDGANYWVVKSKDGLTSYYGTKRSSPIEETWIDPAVIADPDRRDHIFSWKLTLTEDVFGNRIEYSYERERDLDRQEEPHRWDQTYLKAIRYGDYGDDKAPQFLIYVRFLYKERSDPFSEYRSGFEIRTTRRCHHIAVYSLADTLRFIRRYDLVYANQVTSSPDWVPKNGVSLLHQVSVGGVEFPVLNQLENGKFEQARPVDTYPDPFLTQGDAPSAAVAWNVRNHEPSDITTQITPCDYLYQKRETIWVKTTSAQSGLVHDLSLYAFPWTGVGPKLAVSTWGVDLFVRYETMPYKHIIVLS